MNEPSSPQASPPKAPATSGQAATSSPDVKRDWWRNVPLPPKHTARAAILTANSLCLGGPAVAQVSKSGYVLPERLALEAAQAAVNSCAEQGYAVTAIVVDVSGTPEVLLRGDDATIHTKDSAYKKARTIVTMAPIFHLDETSQFLTLLSKYPPLAAQSLASTQNVSALPGGVALKLGNEIVAGIGVAGSPGGDKDEACARARAAKIQSEIQR